MLVSFLVFGKKFSFYSSLFLGLFKGLLSLHSTNYRLIKIESLSFSLVLSRTFELIGFFHGVHPIDLSINLSIVDCGVFIA